MVSIKSVLCVGPRDMSTVIHTLLALPSLLRFSDHHIESRHRGTSSNSELLRGVDSSLSTLCMLVTSASPRDQGKKLTGRIAAMRTNDSLCGLTDTPLISQPGAADMEWWVPRMRPFPVRPSPVPVIVSTHAQTLLRSTQSIWIRGLISEAATVIGCTDSQGSILFAERPQRPASMVVLTGGPALESLGSWMRVESHPPCIAIRKEDTCRIF